MPVVLKDGLRCLIKVIPESMMHQLPIVLEFLEYGYKSLLSSCCHSTEIYFFLEYFAAEIEVYAFCPFEILLQ